MGNCNFTPGATEDEFIVNYNPDLGKDMTGVTDSFMMHKINVNRQKLNFDEYNKMIRIFCMPLYFLQIEKVWEDLDEIQNEYDPQFTNEITLQDIVTHMRKKPNWFSFLEGPTPFKQMLVTHLAAKDQKGLAVSNEKFTFSQATLGNEKDDV